MPLNPDSYDRLRALYKRFDTYPEAEFQKGGVLLKTDAYLAFLDLRKLIEPALININREVAHWRPINTFFTAEPETSLVLLWCPDEYGGEVVMGYWDDDAKDWYRDQQGADMESEPLNPTKWMPIAGLMQAADEREFVVIPRLD
jgi:hypothetical protein